MSRQRTVVKVGTSTLTYENGKMNYRRVEALCKILCDLHNSGEDILLVSSGAIGVGMGKTGLSRRPESTKKKQALAAIGQCELMFMYDKLFGEYNHNVAQILLTADVVETDHTRQNIANTIEELLEMDIIPIINENDTVAIDEIYGNNIADNINAALVYQRVNIVCHSAAEGIFLRNDRVIRCVVHYLGDCVVNGFLRIEILCILKEKLCRFFGIGSFGAEIADNSVRLDLKSTVGAFVRLFR